MSWSFYEFNQMMAESDALERLMAKLKSSPEPEAPAPTVEPEEPAPENLAQKLLKKARSGKVERPASPPEDSAEDDVFVNPEEDILAQAPGKKSRLDLDQIRKMSDEELSREIIKRLKEGRRGNSIADSLSFLNDVMFVSPTYYWAVKEKLKKLGVSIPEVPGEEGGASLKGLPHDQMPRWAGYKILSKDRNAPMTRVVTAGGTHKPPYAVVLDTEDEDFPDILRGIKFAVSEIDKAGAGMDNPSGFTDDHFRAAPGTVSVDDLDRSSGAEGEAIKIHRPTGTKRAGTGGRLTRDDLAGVRKPEVTPAPEPEAEEPTARPAQQLKGGTNQPEDPMAALKARLLSKAKGGSKNENHQMMAEWILYSDVIDTRLF